jgi:hypothetical protein
LKRDAIPSIFPWVSTSNSNERAKRQVKRNEAKERLDSDSSSESSSDNMPLSLPFDDDNVGNDIIYTAEPCEGVEMNECKVNVNVSSVDSTCTQTSTWPSLCVEKFIYDPPGIMFYTGLQTYEVFIFVLATLGNAVYELAIKFTQVTHILTTAVSEMLNKRLSSKFVLCCRILISVKKNWFSTESCSLL